MSQYYLNNIRHAFKEKTIILTPYPSVNCKHYQHTVGSDTTELEPTQTTTTHIKLEIEIEQQEPLNQKYLAGICPVCKKVYAYRKGVAL